MATLAATLGTWWLRPDGDPTYEVIEVADGDTIRVRPLGRATDELETIRIVGIDTPETHHPNKPVECFGPEAAAATAQILKDQVVTIRRSLEPADVYGRTIASVIVDGRSVGAWLVQHGFARVLILAPNDAEARTLVKLEQSARARGVGLWGTCDGAPS